MTTTSFPFSTTTGGRGTTTAPPVTAPANSTGPGSGMAVLGAGISITGNLFISIALNVQKYVHNQIERDRALQGDNFDESKTFTKYKLWWMGVALMAFGELGNFGAYFFAPAVLVAPLGTVTVISNAIIAPCYLGEVFRKRDMAGVVGATLGAILIVACAPEEAQRSVGASELWSRYLSQTGVIVYVTLLIVTATVCYALLRRGYGEEYLLVPLTITTVLGCFTILSVKAVSMLLTETFSGNSQFGSPLLYFGLLTLALGAVFQVRFLNYCMQFFDSTQVVPTFFVMFTLGAISVGGVMYQDFDDMSALRIAGFVCGVLITFIGVWLITSGERLGKALGGASAPSAVGKPGEGDTAASPLLRSVFAPRAPPKVRAGSLCGARSPRSNSRARAMTVRGSMNIFNPFGGLETTPLTISVDERQEIDTTFSALYKVTVGHRASLASEKAPLLQPEAGYGSSA